MDSSAVSAGVSMTMTISVKRREPSIPGATLCA